ncbi:MAG: Smr/MutS family protein [Bacillota bacterium]
MAKFEELNLEENYPTVAEAMELLQGEIKWAKQSGTECMYIIHGYGSSGVGGAIRHKARQWLNAQVRNGNLKAVIPGEEFNVFNSDVVYLMGKYGNLYDLARRHNPGATIVRIR